MENQAKHLVVVVVVVEKARTEMAEMVKLTLHGPALLTHCTTSTVSPIWQQICKHIRQMSQNYYQ
jgi:hypothetical protein